MVTTAAFRALAILSSQVFRWKHGTSWLQTVNVSHSPRWSGTNRLGHGLSLIMTRTSHRENPHNNDANDDEDKTTGILYQSVARNCSFFGILSITHG
jgi:hypothetical protein